MCWELLFVLNTATFTPFASTPYAEKVKRVGVKNKFLSYGNSLFTHHYAYITAARSF